MPAVPTRRAAPLAVFALAIVAFVAAGCGGGALGALEGLASVRPAETPVAPPAVSATPSGSPTDASAAETAIEAFVDRVAAGDLSYRMAFKGRAALAINAADVKGRTDVEGSDFASSFSYDFHLPGFRDYKVQVRAVDGKGYAKVASSGWKTIKGWREDDTNIPFQAVSTIRDVKYLGSEERKDKRVHRISVPDAHLIDPGTIPGQVVGEQVRTATLELLIDDAGKPVAGTWAMRGRGRVGASGQLQEIRFDLDLTFSKVGDDLTVKKP
jgi:hypothetical protein